MYLRVSTRVDGARLSKGEVTKIRDFIDRWEREWKEAVFVEKVEEMEA